MFRMGFAAYFGAAVSLCGCAADPPTFYPVGRAVPAAVTGEVKTTEADFILHRQKIVLGPFVQLQAPVNIPSFSPYRRSFEVSTEDVLFPGLLLEGKATSTGYCTVSETAGSSVIGGPSFRLRSCFTDPETSGTFTHVFLEFGRLGLIRPSPMLAKGRLVGDYPVNPPVAYKVVGADPAGARREVELSIRFEPGNSKAPRLSVIETIGPIEKPLEKASVEIPAAKPFPFVLNIQTARVEIIGLSDGVLTYRMISGFDPRQTHMLDLDSNGEAG